MANEWGDEEANEWGDLPADAPLPAPAPEGPGLGEAIGRGIARGGMARFNDEFVGLARALGSQDPPDFSNESPIVIPPQGDTFGERYRSARKEERDADTAATAAWPKASFISEMFGGGAVGSRLPLPTPAAGASLPARMGQGAAAAAPLGAAYGLGGSEAETLGGQALDTAVGGAGGAAVGGAAPAVGAGLRSAAGPITDWLRKVAIGQGRKVLTGNAGTLSVRKPLSDEAVEEALRQKAIRPFGTTQTAAEVLGTARETVGQRYAQIVADLEAKGVTGPDAQVLASRLLAEADTVAQNSAAASPGPGIIRREAEALVPKSVPAGQPAAGTLPLTQAENIKRSLQTRGKYHKITGETDADEAFRGVASEVRQSVEDAIAAQAAKAPDEAAAFVPVKGQLGRLIEGSDAAETAAARMSRNRGISLTDTIAGAAGMSQAGIPGAAAMALANKVGRTRGPATASWLADKLSGVTGPVAAGQVSPATQRGAATATLPELVEWLRLRGYAVGPAAAGAEDGGAP